MPAGASVAIRITKNVEDRQTILKVDGWLKADDVEELTRVYESVTGAIFLDLSELHSADREGVAILQEIISLGAEVSKASPYIELLLRAKS
jgi:ABC-type transporter Mla MlaB component